MKKPPRISDEEKALFRQAVQGVKPLRKSKDDIVEKPTVPPINIKKNLPPETPQKIELHDGTESTYQANDFLFFSRSGIQQKRLRKLRLGKFSIEGIIDLHGCNSEQAKILLENFLTNAIAQQKRIVQIIHGKGQHKEFAEAILKNKVYGWLVNCDQVLAFCSCQAKDGGTGAVYALLKCS